MSKKNAAEKRKIETPTYISVCPVLCENATKHPAIIMAKTDIITN